MGAMQDFIDMIEALTKLASGEFSKVRPKKWNTEDGSYGYVIFDRTFFNGTYRRTWPFITSVLETLPFSIDDPDIVIGEWEEIK